MISTTVRPGLSSSSTPQYSENQACAFRVVDALVIREHHRDQAGVGGALHVVLAAQRVQAGAGTADLAGNHRQRDQAARIVGAVDVLRNTHAPEDHRTLRSREQARDFAQRVGVDAGDLGGFLRAVIGDVGLQLLVIGGALGDECFRRSGLPR